MASIRATSTTAAILVSFLLLSSISFTSASTSIGRGIRPYSPSTHLIRLPTVNLPLWNPLEHLGTVASTSLIFNITTISQNEGEQQQRLLINDAVIYPFSKSFNTQDQHPDMMHALQIDTSLSAFETAADLDVLLHEQNGGGSGWGVQFLVDYALSVKRVDGEEIMQILEEEGDGKTEEEGEDTQVRGGKHYEIIITPIAASVGKFRDSLFSCHQHAIRIIMSTRAATHHCSKSVGSPSRPQSPILALHSIAMISRPSHVTAAIKALLSNRRCRTFSWTCTRPDFLRVPLVPFSTSSSRPTPERFHHHRLIIASEWDTHGRRGSWRHGVLSMLDCARKGAPCHGMVIKLLLIATAVLSLLVGREVVGYVAAVAWRVYCHGWKGEGHHLDEDDEDDEEDEKAYEKRYRDHEKGRLDDYTGDEDTSDSESDSEEDSEVESDGDDTDDTNYNDGKSRLLLRLGNAERGLSTYQSRKATTKKSKSRSTPSETSTTTNPDISHNPSTRTTTSTGHTLQRGWLSDAPLGKGGRVQQSRERRSRAQGTLHAIITKEKETDVPPPMLPPRRQIGRPERYRDSPARRTRTGREGGRMVLPPPPMPMPIPARGPTLAGGEVYVLRKPLHRRVEILRR